MTINRDKLLSECKRKVLVFCEKVMGLTQTSLSPVLDTPFVPTGEGVCSYWATRSPLLGRTLVPTGQNACPYWAERLLLLGRIAVTATIGL